MLRINQQRSAAGAKTYFEQGLATEDYYAKDSIVGRWGGKGAEKLGLSGDVSRDGFLALCDNLDPNTGRRLTARTKDNRTVGYDFNFHAPKSLSLLYTLTKDERLLRLFQDAVRDTMAELEADVKTRVRQDGQQSDRVTGNLLYAEFVHLTARPVGGMPDPHLHAHCFVFNATFDNEEDRWKAAQFRDVVRDASYYEAAFHARLSKTVADLGLGVERTRNGWEVAGVERGVIEKFSRRTALIEETARSKGVTSAEEKAELGARTREKKGEPHALDDLRQEWKARLTPPEKQSILQVLGGRVPSPEPSVSAEQCVDHALEHGFERSSVVTDRRLLATALKRGYGSVGVDDVKDDFRNRQNMIRRTWDGQSYVTTREVLGEEAAVLTFAREGRGTCAPIQVTLADLSEYRLIGDQERAVRHVLGSMDRVMLIRGAAGTGKTTLLKAAAAEIHACAQQIQVFAPTAEAAHGVLKGDGFADSETVARLLVDPALQQQVNGKLIWIDEAGLLGVQALRQLFAVAEKQNARVVLVGDERQHGSVPRGEIFRLLQSHAGLQAVEVASIQRQKGEYKQAIESLSAGNLADGFARLDQLGAIREYVGDVRHTELAADYLSAVADGKSALVVAPTHAEGQRVTECIREQLKSQGKLSGNERRVDRLISYGFTEAERRDAVNYRDGDVIRLTQNAEGGFRKGESLTVVGRAESGEVMVKRDRGQPVALPLGQANRFDLYRKEELSIAVGDRIRITQNGTAMNKRNRLLNGSLHTVAGFTRGGDIRLENGQVVARNYGHLAHGYATTSHASQGKTVDRVFVALGSESFAAASTEQFYVSCSRGRESVRVYCDDKQELLEAVSRSSARPSATELVESDSRPSHPRTRLVRHGEHTRRLDVIDRVGNSTLTRDNSLRRGRMGSDQRDSGRGR